MTKNFSILKPDFRTCKTSDVDALAALVKQLYDSDPGEYPVKPDISLTIAEFEHHPEKGIVIAIELDNQIVGYAILVFFWSNEFGGDIVEIDELAIDQKHRGRGIGKAFFNWLDAAYTECAGYALQTSEANDAARGLYTAVGFSASKNQYFVKLRR